MMLLDMAVSGFGDRTAVGAGETSLTYAELYRRAGVAAAHLQSDGVAHLAFVGANAPAFPVAVFAAAWAGIPVIPVNYRLGAAQVRELLDQHPDTLVVADETTRHALAGCGHPVVEAEQWLAMASAGEPAGEWPNDPEAIAVLLYTSGTTAAPKAAILRHRHLLSYVFGSVEFAGAAEDEAVLVTVPPYHVAGLANLVSNLFTGRRLVYLPAFSPEAWLATARSERVTHAMVVPTMLARIVDSLEGQDSAEVPSLRSLSYGGSRIAPSIVARALELFSTTDFVNAYGLTETSSTIAILGPEDHRAALASDDTAVSRRLGSAGRLIPGLEAEVRGPDGAVVAEGEPGELWVRGEQVSGEYLSHASPLDEQGWFPTRDRAWFDPEGYLFIEGRADDTIIRGGENIAPAEIEEVLVQHPSVGEVAVVGLPDEEWGQRIAAVVVPAEGHQVDPEELREWARARLRTSKTPDVIDVWAALPYTDTGKLLRRQVLADLATEPSA